MGWLRDLMDQSDSGCRSYGDLARAALKTTDWPNESRMAERSLASILSKLDRNLETDWLAERVGVQRVLAKILQVPLDDVRAPGLSAPATRGDVRRLRLTSLRFARALDLLEEPLCPGLPAGALFPGLFQGTFWRAPSGSGRSLVARYLEARGTAQVIEAGTFEEALARLPERGPVFIELTGQRSGPLPAPPRAELCVAGDFDPGNLSWQLIESPPVASYLEELVAWVAARLPADGRFDAKRTLSWLREEILPSGVLDGLGAALGLCGIADELGVNTLARRSLRQIAERYARDRLSASLDPETPHAGWLKRNAYDVLVGLGVRLLADSELPWDTSRSLESWLELVPAEHQRAADLEWMRLSLSQVDSNIRPADIDKAAKKTPPGAFRIVRALERAQLLTNTATATGDAAPRFSFGPRWFSNVLRLDSLQALLAGSPSDWGEALLRGHAASSLARELVQELSLRGSRFIDTALELEGHDDAAHAAAIDLTFRASGIALLGGAELAADSLEALWDETIDMRLEFPDLLPCPRIEYPASERDPILSRGTWYLAAFAISAELGQRSGSKHPLLRPWQVRDVTPPLREVCAIIARDLPETERDRPWVLAAFALIGKLRAEIGALGGAETPLFVERPAVILDEVLHGVLTWSTVAGIDSSELGLLALHSLATARAIPFATVAAAIWNAWDDAHRPSDGAQFLAPDAPLRAWFWPHIPDDLLEVLLCDARADNIPYEAFGEAQWRAFLAALDVAETRASDATAFACAPESVLSEALARGIDSPALLTNVWRRAPARAINELVRSFEAEGDSDAPRLRALLESAQDPHFDDLFELFSRQLRLSNLARSKLEIVRHFLHDHVRNRRPRYESAYARLSDIERQLALAR